MCLSTRSSILTQFGSAPPVLRSRLQDSQWVGCRMDVLHRLYRKSTGCTRCVLTPSEASNRSSATHVEAERCPVSDLEKLLSALFQLDAGALGEDGGCKSDPGFTRRTRSEGSDCLHELSLPRSCRSRYKVAQRGPGPPFVALPLYSQLCLQPVYTATC